MRQVKNEGIYFSKELFNKFVEKNGEYFLEIKDRDLLEEEKEIIKKELYRGTTRPAICKKLGISEQTINKFLQETYKTKKISDIRQKLFDEQDKK